MADAAGPLLAEIEHRFRFYRTLAENAVEQVDDEAFFATLGPPAAHAEGENAIAVLVKHLAGNFRSRWTDFLTADGEKPDRHRDTEFELDEVDTREALMVRWAEGWQLLDEAFRSLPPDAASRTVTIRGEPHTVTDALLRALGHAAYHVGQIVVLAKHHAGADWQSLSIPRGQSEPFAAAHRRRFA
jgi:hypothetical protein